MRALLTPEIAPRMGIVLFRPGSELMPLFMQGRVLLEPEPEHYSSFASGAVPAASQPLADDPAVRAVFRNEAVIRRAGGVECLESWLLREKGCQWPHSDWHSENMTTMRHAPGAIRLCWHCDNQLRDQFTERLESMATDNCARWVLSVVRRDLDFNDNHAVTMIGHGQGGMGTKAHDLFGLPLCRKHHDELHADTVAFEEKYGSQLELIFRFIDRALAIGVLA
ncbi:DUF968 domain-containing protein [Escherichia coli]|uniref:DUF968 domain-containing protein n=2 Tax=Escherichia coli TaxID=562 RepID=UPI000AE2AE83|nr:putative prophage protein [Escherichia coli]